MRARLKDDERRFRQRVAEEQNSGRLLDADSLLSLAAALGIPGGRAANLIRRALWALKLGRALLPRERPRENLAAAAHAPTESAPPAEAPPAAAGDVDPPASDSPPAGTPAAESEATPPPAFKRKPRKFPS